MQSATTKMYLRSKFRYEPNTIPADNQEYTFSSTAATENVNGVSSPLDVEGSTKVTYRGDLCVDPFSAPV
jgi:hypothetical protein